MSYDLMVLEPEAALKKHDAFVECYFALTKWNDGPYDDPALTSTRLRTWVQEMRRTFPDMNTPEYARQCKTRPQCAARAVLCGGLKVCHRRILFS
jgi:hypothetical protein